MSGSLLDGVRETLPAAAELVDSSSVWPGDPAALRANLRRDSYLLFRRLLPPEEVRAAGRQVEEVLVDHGWVASRNSLEPVLPIRQFGEPEFRRTFRRLLAIEDLHRLAHLASLVQLMGALVGGDVIVHPRKVLRLCFPHALDPASTTRAHQDHPYIQGGIEGLASWVPLTSAPRERGALAVLAGSASEGIRPMVATDPRLGCGAVAVGDIEAHRWHSADFEPGDVLLFHSLTVHGSLPNRTPAMRISVDFRYRAVAQPLAIPEMWPPYDPELGSWEGLIPGWSTTRWISVPPGTRVIGSRLPKFGLTVPASEMVGAEPSVLPRLGVAPSASGRREDAAP